MSCVAFGVGQASPISRQIAFETADGTLAFGLYAGGGAFGYDMLRVASQQRLRVRRMPPLALPAGL